MKSIEYKIETINPIIISRNTGDRNMLNTKTYIPGNSILGIFSNKFIKQNKFDGEAHKNESFYNWFCKGDVIFTDAFIFNDSKKKRYFPTPISIKKEKYRDKLINFIFDDFEESTKTLEGYSNINNGSIKLKSVKKNISFHHARDIETGKSKEGVIFNYENIESNQYFVGNIIGEDKTIKDFLEKFEKEFIAYIGRSKNSQYGKVKIKLSDSIEYTSEISTNYKTDDEIVMTFLSDAIIYNKYGFSTTNLEDISAYLGVDIKKGFIKKDRVEQFVGIWKLKKQSENVISAGSCFLLKKLPCKYIKFEKNGIGERTDEGYGRIVFGYQKNKTELHYTNSESVKIDKPTDKIPGFVKILVKKIVINKIKEKAVHKAMEDAEKFKNLPTKTLLGKLQLFTRDIDNFKTNYEKLIKNKPAKDKLKKANNGEITLLDHLKKNNLIKFSELVPVDTDKLLKEIGESNIDNSDDLKKEIQKIYLETFINFLRKTKKRG